MTRAVEIAGRLTEDQKRACLAGESWYPRCRGCADEDGTCPHWYNWPCEWNARQPFEAAVRYHLQAMDPKG